MNRKLFALAITVALIGGGAQQSLAAYWGYVKGVEVRDSTDYICTVVFEFEGTPAYSIRSGKYGIPFDVSWQEHRPFFSSLLTAYMTGKKVAIWVPVDGDGFINPPPANNLCDGDGDGAKSIDKLLQIQ